MLKFKKCYDTNIVDTFFLNQTRNIDKMSVSHFQSGLDSGGRTSDEGFMGARRSIGRGSARWFLFPTKTWEPLLLTWVVQVSARFAEL